MLGSVVRGSAAISPELPAGRDYLQGISLLLISRLRLRLSSPNLTELGALAAALLLLVYSSFAIRSNSDRESLSLHAKTEFRQWASFDCTSEDFVTRNTF